MIAELKRLSGGLGRIVVLAVAFILLIAGTGFLIALFLGWLRASFHAGANIYIGLVCSLIAWLFVAVFHLRRETIVLPILERDFFLEQVRAALSDLGYEVKAESLDCWICKPAFRSLVLGGAIHVAIDNQTGKISGPKLWMEILRKRLRIRNHLDHIHQAIQDSQRRMGERLLNRVHLRLRFDPAAWPEVQRHIVEPLARQGDVVCELNLLAQNDAGIPERMVDVQVRPWLAAQRIQFEIHKDPALKEAVVRPRHHLARQELKV